MILSDHTIREYIRSGAIKAEPRVTEKQIQPASLDVRIEGTLRDARTDEPLDTLELKPNRRYHAYTRERVELPVDIAAQLTGRSSIARRGVIVHKTAGWIDPGFCGKIKMELYNHADHRVGLEPQQRVAQLVFMQTDQPTSGYDGQYQNQEPEE